MTVVLNPAMSNGVVAPIVLGNHFAVTCKVTLSGVYKTGGDVSLLALIEAIFLQEGRGTIDWIDVKGVPGYLIQWNPETKKLQVFRTGAAVKGVFEELPEEEYPAALRGEGKLNMLAIGR